MSEPRLVVENLTKTFFLHRQGGVQLPVLQGLSFSADGGECVVLNGPSGAGKSTLLRCLYGNYLPDSGSIRLHDGEQWVELVDAPPRTVLRLRQRTMGYVSQFLRAVPRVPAIDVVAEPLRLRGVEKEVARERTGELLDRLHIPERLWSLAPATFSGGEQQRVNIARGLVAEYPILLLDEPTASLDAENRAVVVELINEAVARGSAVIGIFHAQVDREMVADRVFELSAVEQAA